MTTKDEIKNRISMALRDPVLQQGFEIICRENNELENTKVKIEELETRIEKMQEKLEHRNCVDCSNYDGRRKGIAGGNGK